MFGSRYQNETRGKLSAIQKQLDEIREKAFLLHEEERKLRKKKQDLEDLLKTLKEEERDRID